MKAVKILNKEPYKGNMTHTSIIAYMYILNRLNLSRINKLFDNDGDIFIYYSVISGTDGIKLLVNSSLNITVTPFTLVIKLF